MNKPHQPPDDEWSAPESGTVRDETSGNNPSPSDRGFPTTQNGKPIPKDDPSMAGEER